MLKVMRDSFHHLKWILLGVVLAFVIGFVFIDMGLGGAASGQKDDRAYAARVNGQTISYRDFQRALYFTTENYKRMYGQQFTDEMAEAMGLQKQVLDTLVDQRLLMQESDRLHMTATQDEIRRKILSIPTLNPDGKFVGQELYTRFVQQIGFDNAADFEEDLARQITLDKMESALSDAVVVSPKAAEAEYRRISENAKIRYVLYPTARESALVSVTEPEIAAYYNANKSKYTHTEQRKLRYLIADYAKLRALIQPSEQQLRDRYEATKADYRNPPSAHVLHILIKVDPQKATPEQDAAAKAKAEGIVAQLKGGADFGALAKANSEDPSSSQNGGDMGFFNQGQMVSSFDEKVFTAPINSIELVRSPEYGYHIIKVLERKPEGMKTFEEVRTQLAQQVIDQMSKEQARDAVAKVMQQVRDARPKTADEFSKFATDKVVSNDTGWFQKIDQIPGLGYNNVISQWAFQAKLNDLGEVIGTNRGPAIPFLEAIRPADVSPLAEVKEKVTNDARNQKAEELAKQKLQAAMLGAPTVDAIAAKLGLVAADTTVQRQGFTTGIQGDTSSLMEAAMAANPGEIKGPVVAGTGAIAFQVLEQKKITADELAQNRQSYVDQLRTQEARSLRQSLLQRLRKSAKVDINQKIIAPRATPEGA